MFGAAISVNFIVKSYIVVAIKRAAVADLELQFSLLVFTRWSHSEILCKKKVAYKQINEY